MVSLFLRIPLLVVLLAIGALAMIVPAAYAAFLGDWLAARAFALNGLVLFALVAFIALVTLDWSPRNPTLSHLSALVGVHLVAPPLLALPLLQLMPGGTWLEASAMMVEALTTTGAEQLVAAVADHPRPELVLPHRPTMLLWAGLVAWLGGFLGWVAALAILGPLNLLGIDGDGVSGGPSREWRSGVSVRGAEGEEASWRVMRVTLRLLPVWLGLTLVLWAGLVALGESAHAGALTAMATMATSGILSPYGGMAGWGGELLIALFLLPAVSRWFYRPLAGYRRRFRGRLWQDPEIRLAAILVGLATGLFFLRHWWESNDLWWRTIFDWLSILWSGFFTSLGFLTTAGFASQGWDEVVLWSGMKAPGMVLMALALVGGGVATTAGGLKLLRTHALLRHVVRERNRMIHPHLAEGSSGRPDDPRGSSGLGWLVFMLFLVTLALLVFALGLVGMPFAEALALSMSALTTTGPLAGMMVPSVSWGDLPPLALGFLSLGMIAGRLELLALVVVVLRDEWG